MEVAGEVSGRNEPLHYQLLGARPSLRPGGLVDLSLELSKTRWSVVVVFDALRSALARDRDESRRQIRHDEPETIRSAGSPIHVVKLEEPDALDRGNECADLRCLDAIGLASRDAYILSAFIDDMAGCIDADFVDWAFPEALSPLECDDEVVRNRLCGERLSRPEQQNNRCEANKNLRVLRGSGSCRHARPMIARARSAASTPRYWASSNSGSPLTSECA